MPLSPLRRTAALALAALVLPLPGSAQTAADGAALYAELCASCHGADLRGGLGPSLVDDIHVHGADRASVLAVIHDGVEATGMPAFGDALSPDEMDAVADYLVDIRGGRAATPAVPTDTLQTLDYAVGVEIFADGLDEPWAIDFLDARTALVTEKTGALRLVRDGQLLPEPVRGTPAVLAEGQGGLLDVTVDPDVEQNGWIYLSYSHPIDAPGEDDPLAMTRIVRGRIESGAWTDEEVIFEAPASTYLPTRHHYGNRIVFDDAGHLYFTIGDRGRQDDAQDLSRPNGKVHRILPDGSIPADNPFVDRPEALPSIYSYGHRNPQGLTIDPETGAVWAVEHGPRGGDELNRVLPGRNYGWPVITYGINYNGTVITEAREREGMEQPVAYWRPSIAVSGLHVYDGDLFPRWRGHLLAGALRDQEVRLLDLDGDRVQHQEVLLKDAGRVREAAVGPDGAVYVVLNAPNQVVRLVPVEARITN